MLSNNLKAKKILSWKPKFTKEKGFYEGLKKTIQWFKENKNLSKYNPDQYNV